MRKIIVTMFMSLDGVIGDSQNWSFSYWNDAIEKFKNEELISSDAQLLGRVTYQGFAAAWPARTGDYADRLNSLPKYIVSTTLGKAEWNNSHLIKENVPEELARLKQLPGQDILVHGSRTLVQMLIQHDLIDEYRLLVFPLVLGRGMRLFDEGSAATLNLVEAKAMGSGVVLLRYEPDRKAG
jgi:dihydrofolate reductase